MNHLVLARHGHYNDDGRLSKTGVRQIQSLSEKLKAICNGDSVLILSSPVDRARQSAEILSQNLETDLEIHDILWSDCDHMEDFDGTIELVRLKLDQAQTLILVTHYEYVESFPAYFAKHELGVELASWLIDPGEAWVIDCRVKKISRLQPRCDK